MRSVPFRSMIGHRVFMLAPNWTKSMVHFHGEKSPLLILINHWLKRDSRFAFCQGKKLSGTRHWDKLSIRKQQQQQQQQQRQQQGKLGSVFELFISLKRYGVRFFSEVKFFYVYHN